VLCASAVVRDTTLYRSQFDRRSDLPLLLPPAVRVEVPPPPGPGPAPGPAEAGGPGDLDRPVPADRVPDGSPALTQCGPEPEQAK
jgi:hypothetical protein